MLTEEQHRQVATAIRKSGLTQAQLAKAAGCSLRAVARIANYRASIGLTTALMARLFPVIGLEFTIQPVKQEKERDQ